MAQVSDIQVPNQPRSTYRSGNNAVFEAIVTDFSGNTAPSNPRSFMKWKDTSTTPATYRERNAANNAWIVIGRADTTNWGLATADNANLTGTPLAPTAAAGTATTQIANCAFVETPTLSWVSVTFQNSFANIGSFQVCQYARFRGFVFLRGLATRSTSGLVSGMALFSLPVGFRPAAAQIYSLDSQNNPGAQLFVGNDGSVTYNYSGTPGISGSVFPSLSGVFFAL